MLRPSLFTGLFTALSLALLFALPAAASAQEANGRAAGLAIVSADTRHQFLGLLDAAGGIHDQALRAAVLDLLRLPVPRFMSRLAEPAARERVRRELIAARLLDRKVTAAALFPSVHGVQPFDAAPGGPHGTHHAFPGGLVQHTTFNLEAALAMEEHYRTFYRIDSIDHDLILAAPILHDAMKPFCLQWKADGTFTRQATIAGAPSHHIFILAEAIHRQLAVELIVAVASAHEPPTESGQLKVVSWLRAAAIVAGVDPVERGLLEREGAAFVLPRIAGLEAIISHLSDHDHVLTDPAATVVEDSLARGIRRETAQQQIQISDTELRWARHRILSQLPEVRLYALYRLAGDEEVARELERRSVPWWTEEDRGVPAAPEPELQPPN